MKTLHRVLSLGAVALMLYLAATGSALQLIDLSVMASHPPDASPVMQSINEEGYGSADFRVISSADLTAAALPARLDIAQALATVLRGLRAHSPQAQPSFVELRMAHGVPIGQVRLGRQIVAFDALSGQPTPPAPQGSLRPAPSVRQGIKDLHRFWGQQPLPGACLGVLCGLALLVLLISGLTLYVQELDERHYNEQHGLFWRSGAPWSDLHRTVSVLAALFVTAIAGSGTWLAFDGAWHSFATRQTSAEAAAPLADFDVQEMAKITLAGLQAAQPGTPIKVLRLRMYGAVKQGVVITGGRDTRQLVFNADTGLPAGLTEPGYPASSGYPLGMQVHETLRQFHSGALFGIPTRLVNLLTGLALLYLSVSGIVLYRDRKRRA